jgi:hypothetical protein
MANNPMRPALIHGAQRLLERGGNRPEIAGVARFTPMLNIKPGIPNFDIHPV